MLLVGGGVLGVVLVPLVPEPVAGLVLDPLGVLVLLPMVEPVIELSLPVPPVPVPYVPVLPVVDPLVVAELSVAWSPARASRRGWSRSPMCRWQFRSATRCPRRRRRAAVPLHRARHRAKVSSSSCVFLP